MSEAHKQIVREILEEAKKDPAVLGVRLFGSVGRGEERPDSDVDIEVVYKEGHFWNYEGVKIHGIHVDFVKSSKDFIIHQFRDFPYISFIDLGKNILYDPAGFLGEMKRGIHDYMNKNKEVSDFWKKSFDEMRRNKSLGEDPHNLKEQLNKAEELFSPEHKVSRDWLR